MILKGNADEMNSVRLAKRIGGVVASTRGSMAPGQIYKEVPGHYGGNLAVALPAPI